MIQWALVFSYFKEEFTDLASALKLKRRWELKHKHQPSDTPVIYTGYDYDIRHKDLDSAYELFKQVPCK